jgi:isopenicillin N synthase-like dioxygenase
MPPVLVNIGDLLSFWTGGLLKSTVHRVVFEESRDAAERYSIAFFCHPARDTELVSVPSAMVKAWIEEKGDEDKVGYGAMGYGRAVTAQEHLQGRLAATYGWGKVKDDVAAS